MINNIIIFSVVCLFPQIYITAISIFNERKFETFLSTTQFNDSKEGRILALLFWNLIPVLPILYLFIKVIVLIAIEEKLFEDLNRNIIRIKNQIKGISK